MSQERNPFNITFGKEPASKISRENDLKVIYDSFLNENPSSEVYIITGPRGSGKTVSLSLISEDFKSYDKWLVIELNPNNDLLEQLASKLYDEGKLKKLFIKMEFNFSFSGVRFTLKGDEPILNISTLLKRELEYLKKKNYKVLITIDEATNSDYMRSFAHEFQLFLRNNYSVFLLITGLYQNISLLEKQKSLTFFLRAPKIYLPNLNYRSIANTYKTVFKITEEEAIKLTKLTNGYAFAFQLLGNILFSKKKTEIDEDVLNTYDELLQERVYDLVFDELSPKEKELLFASCEDNSNKYILSKTGMSLSQLSNYKKVLCQKGIISSAYHSSISFELPRFKEFLIFMKTFLS